MKMEEGLEKQGFETHPLEIMNMANHCITQDGLSIRIATHVESDNLSQRLGSVCKML